ncbi:MAG: sigma-70 family RNA polymerase sigma factor [Gemmatimonadales bacterium]|nr:sigma-70 family RNA polymerase sigma factor [Gemmatimonadales bacterium]
MMPSCSTEAPLQASPRRRGRAKKTLCAAIRRRPSPKSIPCGQAAGWTTAPLRRYVDRVPRAAARTEIRILSTAQNFKQATPDDLLVRAMAAGESEAMGLLYDRWSSSIFGLALRITREKADAEEVVVDAFAQAWRDAKRFEPGRGSVGAWLATIARSRALDLVRATGRRNRLADTAAASSVDATVAMGSPTPSPSARVEDEERSRKVRAALDELPAPQRAALELAYFGGLSQTEIAERLSEPLGTVKTRVRLGLHKLREQLAALGPLGAA